MISKDAVIDVLTAIRRDIRINGDKNYYLLLSVCEFINKIFCDCKLVEYWVFDLSFGEHESKTEMGFELKGIDSIEKMATFLISKYDSKNKSELPK